MMEGWICPRCGRVNAPWKATCDCRPTPVKYTSQASEGEKSEGE